MKFDSGVARGLLVEEAAKCLLCDGFNGLPSAKPKKLLTIAFGILREPMFELLVACGVIYLILGSRQEG